MAHCEYSKDPPFRRRRTLEEIKQDDAAPYSHDMDAVEAKGGHGGGHFGGHGGKSGPKIVGGGGHTSSASSESVSNPFAVLRGPILLLNLVLKTNRDRASRGESEASARDLGFVGKTR